MACEPGEEERLTALAGELDATIRALKTRIGEIGDRRIAVMAGLTVLDRLKASEARCAELERRVEQLENARQAAALAAEDEDEPLIARLDAATAAVERLTATLNAETHALTQDEAEGAATFSRASRAAGDGPSGRSDDEAGAQPAGRSDHEAGAQPAGRSDKETGAGDEDAAADRPAADMADAGATPDAGEAAEPAPDSAPRDDGRGGEDGGEEDPYPSFMQRG